MARLVLALENLAVLVPSARAKEGIPSIEAAERVYLLREAVPERVPAKGLPVKLPRSEQGVRLVAEAAVAEEDHVGGIGPRHPAMRCLHEVGLKGVVRVVEMKPRARAVRGEDILSGRAPRVFLPAYDMRPKFPSQARGAV